MNRAALSAEKYEQLFSSPPDVAAGQDPELMAILRHVIFGEVFRSVGWTIAPANSSLSYCS